MKPLLIVMPLLIVNVLLARVSVALLSLSELIAGADAMVMGLDTAMLMVTSFVDPGTPTGDQFPGVVQLKSLAMPVQFTAVGASRASSHSNLGLRFRSCACLFETLPDRFGNNRTS
jgi:hypothetical protein